MAKRTGITGKVREACKKLSRERTYLQVAAVADLVGTKTYKETDRVRDALKELCRQGDIRRRMPGVYEWVGKRTEIEKKTVMERLFRARRHVTIGDMVELCGVSDHYAKEWLCEQVKAGAARRDGKFFRLVAAEKIEVKNEAKADRLRAIRARKNEFIRALDALLEAVFVIL